MEENKLQKFADELKAIANAEPVDLLPLAADTETETVEIVFFQRYFRTKKVTEKTGINTFSLRTEIKEEPVKASWSDEHQMYMQTKDVSVPVIKDGKKQFKKSAAVNSVTIENFAFGKMFKVAVHFDPTKGKALNQIIGKAVSNFKEQIKVCNLKGINKSQPLYCVVPVGNGIVISNYQLYGSANKPQALQAKNLIEGGMESDFARTMLWQFETVIDRLKGNALTVSPDWNKVTIQWPELKQLKRTVEKKSN